jgi:ribosomal protein S18 acetylase RimI-like enzyme
VEHILDNPVYHGLQTGDAALSLGRGEVKFFNEEVSPFAGFREGYVRGFDDLYDQLPAGRKILYATPKLIRAPVGWKLAAELKGIQFVFDTTPVIAEPAIKLILLGKPNVDEMMELAALTKPGPFGRRTIEFGHYYGIFENGKLVAMAGQRLHPADFSEISAVCTHPDHLGKGFAALLLQHQLQLIFSQGGVAFLHVREDNHRAIALYKRLGFKIRGPMNFYFLERGDQIDGSAN